MEEEEQEQVLDENPVKGFAVWNLVEEPRILDAGPHNAAVASYSPRPPDDPLRFRRGC